MARKYWKEQSKLEWYTVLPDDQALHNEGLQIGCLQRIADATEKMAQPFQQLINDREHFKNATNRLAGENKKLRKQVAAYQGIIKRTKKQK